MKSATFSEEHVRELIDGIFNGRITELKNGRKVFVPMDLRSYVINEQVEREIQDIRNLKKQVIYMLEGMTILSKKSQK